MIITITIANGIWARLQLSETGEHPFNFELNISKGNKSVIVILWLLLLSLPLIPHYLPESPITGSCCWDITARVATKHLIKPLSLFFSISLEFPPLPPPPPLSFLRTSFFSHSPPKMILIWHQSTFSGSPDSWLGRLYQLTPPEKNPFQLQRVMFSCS